MKATSRTSRPIAVSDIGRTTPQRAAILLRSLRGVTTALAKPLTVEEIAEVVVKGAMTAMGARTAVLALACEGERELRSVHDVGLSGEARRRLSSITPDAPGLIARVAHTHSPTFVRSLGDAFATHSPVRRGPTMLGSGALAALPMSYAERRLGVIVLGWPRDREFSEDDRSFLTVLTDSCALALVHALRPQEPGPATTWRVGDIEIDPAGNRVLIAGRAVHLTPSEFHMLALLAEQPGRCRSRRELLSHLWHTDHVGDERACDAHLANMRKKIERDPSHPERLVTVRGMGYALQIHPVTAGS